MWVPYKVTQRYRTQVFWARPVSFAMKHKVEAELDRLLATGVIEPVKYTPVGSSSGSCCEQDGIV